MSKLFDVSKDLELINKSSLQLGTNLKDIRKNTSTAYKGFTELSATLKSADDASSKFGKSLGALGKIGSGAAFGILEVVEAGGKIAALATIANAAYGSFKQLSGISRTLTFEEAILGTTNLTKNFQYLENTGNKALDSIKLSLQSVFDAQNFNKFAGDAVAAFAPVEQAAYRLSTVTVASGERSVDALDKNIASMRNLQKATNDALGSVELLNAQYDIASAGFTAPKDTQKVGKASVNLSQAGFGDLAGSTNATVRVLRALGDESDKADLRASQLFETTRVGLLTLDQLTPIIGSLSVQSKQLGVDFAEVTASVAGLTTQGASAGEASTRLEALFGEIVNAAPQANKVLSEFRDEAGKPIQLNASALKQKGIRGIVKDIQTATGGDVAKISQLFSTKEATEAVQLLISLGDKAFKEYTERIKNVDTADLGKEAEGRTKTISGAFSQAQNIGARQVEEFGSGFGEKVVDDVLNANQAFKGFATGAAESIGKITGSVSAMTEKIKGIGGFFVTAFTTVAPFAIFAVISTKIKKIGDQLKKEAKNGETVWDVVKRKAVDAFADIYRKWVSTMDKVKAKAKEAGKEIENALASGNADSNTKQLSLFNSLPDKKIKDGPINSKPDLSDIKNTRSKLKSKDFGQQLDLDFTAPKLKGIAGLKADLTAFGTKSKAAFSTVRNASQVGFSALAKGGSMAAPLIKTTLGMLGGLAVGAGVAGVALALAGSWVSTFGALLDKKSNPALQEMVSNLKDIKNVEGLQDILKEFDPLAASIESSNFAVNVLNESVTRLGGLWDIASGASTKFNSQTKPEIERINALLDTQIAKNKELAQSGKVGTDTIEGKKAEDKISKGITLSGDDETALKNETSSKQKIIDAQIANQEILVKQKAETDRYDTAGLEKEKEKLAALKTRAEEEKKLLQKALDAKLVEQQIKRFKDIDTSIPISVQLQEQSTQSIKAQIKDIKDTLNTPTGDIFGDPAKYASEFGELVKKISNTTDAIQVEVEIDASNAERLRDEMVKEIGQDNFDKIVASNPQFRQKFSDLNKSVTSGNNAQTKFKETASTSVLDAAQGAGSESTSVAAAKYAEQTKSINAQVKTLNAELNRPETTLNRQRELIAEIEQLEASRLKLDIDGKISKELGARKQQLTLDQELLNVKKSTLNLFNQESQFASLAITASQAKLQAAKQELAFKKEQISISSKEEQIKKQSIVDSLAKKESRGKEQASAGLGDKFKADDPNLRQKLDANKETFTAKTNADTASRKEVLKSDASKKLADLEKASKVFSDKEQQQISDALKYQYKSSDLAKSATFNKDGTLKDDESKLQSRLDKEASNKFGSFDSQQKARDASDIIGEKDLKFKKDKQALQSETSRGQSELDSAATREIEKRSSLLDAVESRVKAGLDGQSSTSGKEESTSNTDSSTSDSESSDKGTTAQDDLNFTKAISAVREKLGTLAERIAVNEAKIEAEFAGREKLIKRGELLGESLKNLASKSSLFADTFAGQSLNLAALKSTNNSARLQKEADLEIAKVTQKVKDLAQNAADAAEAATIAASAGADAKTVKKLQDQASDAGKLAETAKNEQAGDIEFIKQKTALDKLTAAIDIAEATINKEFSSRERLVQQTNEIADGFNKLAGSSIFSGTIAADSLNLSAAQTRQSSGAIDTKADKDIALVNERIKAIQELAKQEGPAGDEARKDLGKIQKEATRDIETININRGLQKVAEAAEIASLQVSKEFSERERLSQQTSELADGFGRLASNSLLSGSAGSASLNVAQAQTKIKAGSADAAADKELALIQARVDTFRKLAEEKGPGGDLARRDLAKVEQQAVKDSEAVNSTRAIENISNSFELATAQIEKETASRQRLVDINESLAGSFSSLAGAIGSLFKNSSIGASLNRFSAQVQSGSNKAQVEYDKQTAILRKRSTELNKAASQAASSGASPEAVAELNAAAAADSRQRPVEEAYLKQKLVLDTMTQKFQLMSAEVEEVSDKLAKQADLIKQSIELEDRKRSAALENNKSGTGLQSALVNFLGKNNPVAQQLQQRLDIQQARDDAKGQQAQNVSDAKKEIIDTTLQKSQLDLEQRNYENAITQTALLSDLVAIGSGGQASASQSDLIKQQVNNLPNLFKQGQEDAAKRASLLEDRLSYIPQELDSKQANVKRNLLSNELNTLGGNLNAGNIDLLTRTLTESENELKSFKRQDFEVGSLSDKKFSDQLKSIGGSRIPAPSRQDYLVDNRVKTAPPVANNVANQSVAIQAPVNIKIETPSGSNIDVSKWQQTIMRQTGDQVNTAMTNLSKQIATYAKKF